MNMVVWMALRDISVRYSGVGLVVWRRIVFVTRRMLMILIYAVGDNVFIRIKEIKLVMV